MLTSAMNELPSPHEVDLRLRLEALGREVYGQDYETFLVTPRRPLHGETPEILIERGDLEPVRQVLIQALEGDFA